MSGLWETATRIMQTKEKPKQLRVESMKSVSETKKKLH